MSHIASNLQDWLGAENWYTLDFRNLILPNQHKTYTELLDLTPLPLSALNEPKYEELYTQKLTHFNPIQVRFGECVSFKCHMLIYMHFLFLTSDPSIPHAISH